jgi:hypothetical protein
MGRKSGMSCATQIWLCRRRTLRHVSCVLSGLRLDCFTYFRCEKCKDLQRVLVLSSTSYDAGGCEVNDETWYHMLTRPGSTRAQH